MYLNILVTPLLDKEYLKSAQTVAQSSYPIKKQKQSDNYLLDHSTIMSSNPNSNNSTNNNSNNTTIVT